MRVAKRDFGHDGCLVKRRLQLVFGMDFVNAPAAAAAFGFEHNGKSDLMGNFSGFFNGHRAFRTGNHRHVEFFGQPAHIHFVAQGFHGICGRSDKRYPCFITFCGKTFIFRNKSPAGMNPNGTAIFCFFNNQFQIQVGVRIIAEKEQFIRTQS